MLNETWKFEQIRFSIWDICTAFRNSRLLSLGPVSKRQLEQKTRFPEDFLPFQSFELLVGTKLGTVCANTKGVSERVMVRHRRTDRSLSRRFRNAGT